MRGTSTSSCGIPPVHTPATGLRTQPCRALNRRPNPPRLAGQEGFEQLRVLSYPATDIYLIGYSCASLISLNNIEAKWMKEITKSREENLEEGEPWIIMVGTKEHPPEMPLCSPFAAR